MITMFVTEQDLKDVFGEDFEIEITPEIAAQFMTSEFSTEAILRMKEQDLTLKDLAEKIGIKSGTLSEKLNGSNMTFKSAAQIAIALGCDIEAPKLIDKQDSGKTAIIFDISELKSCKENRLKYEIAKEC